MPGTHLVYWDVGPFLRFVQRDHQWLPVVSALLEQSASRDSEIQIVTSTLTIAQVAYAEHEGTSHELDDAVMDRIRYVLEDREAVKPIEFHELTAARARDLVREAVSRGWNRKVEDMIHLASAVQESVSEIHTLDGGLAKWAEVLGIPITEPVAAQPRLFE